MPHDNMLLKINFISNQRIYYQILRHIHIHKNKMLNFYFRYQSHFANLAWIIPTVITSWICTIIMIMALSHPKGDLKLTLTPPEVRYFDIMAIGVVEFSREGHKIRKVFA